MELLALSLGCTVSSSLLLSCWQSRCISRSSFLASLFSHNCTVHTQEQGISRLRKMWRMVEVQNKLGEDGRHKRKGSHKNVHVRTKHAQKSLNVGWLFGVQTENWVGCTNWVEIWFSSRLNVNLPTLQFLKQYASWKLKDFEIFTSPNFLVQFPNHVMYTKNACT